MRFLSNDLGIDLGTANVLIYADEKGIVLREPSMVAIDRNTSRILKVGSDARNMMGRTPGNVVTMRPLRDGVITDHEMTEKMLEEFFRKVIKHSLVKPRVIISVPSSVSEIEERAVINAAMEAGARRVYLIEEPLAAARGANLDISGPNGQMVVDIGGGTTDIAVLTMNAVAVSASVKAAGDSFDEAIIRYARRRYGVVLGASTAEDVKINIGCVVKRPENLAMTVSGRDLKTGLAREITLQSDELCEEMYKTARRILDVIMSVMERTTPELVSDVAANGIVLTGGGSQLWGMDQIIAEKTQIPCTIADDAASCVALGCGKCLEWINHMNEGTINIARKRLVRD